MMKIGDIKNIYVIGAGNMGHQISWNKVKDGSWGCPKSLIMGQFFILLCSKSAGKAAPKYILPLT